jgi:hypothetical protein
MNKLIFTLSAWLFFINAINAQTQTQSVLCGGVERWSVKVLTDPNVNTVNFTPVITTLDILINLSTPIPTSSNPRIAGIEDKVYTIRCHITIKKSESDYDYHLVLSDGIHTLIAETPDPACATASSSAYVNNFIAVRNFVDANIAAGNVYNVNLPDVDVTGVAFIDLEHGQTGVAPNNIELHPMLDIHFSPVGINETKEKLLSVNISPNPFQENIQVEVLSKLNNLQKCSIQFFNSNASLVAENKLSVLNHNKISETINTKLISGTYIYRIINNGKLIYDGKLIKD